MFYVRSVEKNETIYPPCILPISHWNCHYVCTFSFIHLRVLIMPEPIGGTGPVVIQLVITYTVTVYT
jgi:hypothetical protein